MVIKTTVWNPKDPKSKTEHKNSCDAAKIVSEFPVFTENKGPTDSPRLKGMHTVWACESFETESGNIDEKVLEQIAERIWEEEWNDLNEEEREMKKQSIKAPSLRQYLDWSPGKSLDKVIARYGRPDSNPVNQEGRGGGQGKKKEKVIDPYINFDMN